MVIATNTHNHNENNQYDETDQLFFTFAITVLWVDCHGNHKHKLDALKVMAPRLVDIEDYDKIIKQFSFSLNREKAMKILMKR